jgi:prepilin-type N-terminal cleavage/methylation domain-containing protein
MSSFIRRKQEKGFTIIEVMIVLAIAGLIMLIVFLAVPALQRTARNTQRKNDASAIAAALANFYDNNAGQVPSGLGVDPSDSASIDICAYKGSLNPVAASACGLAGGPAGQDYNYETAKLGYYAIYAGTNSNFTLENANPSDTETSDTQVKIDLGLGCNATNTGAAATTNPRTAAVLYATENASGTSTQCLEQ